LIFNEANIIIYIHCSGDIIDRQGPDAILLLYAQSAAPEKPPEKRLRVSFGKEIAPVLVDELICLRQLGLKEL
jgi:hypothetical protein